MSRTLGARLRALAGVLAAEVERNPAFAQAVADALDLPTDQVKSKARSGRRQKGPFDPVEVLREAGEPALRERLAALDIEALKDIIAENGMDQRRLALKWKDPGRLSELIITASQSRMVRGDVFR